MSRNYKFADQTAIYFVTCSVVEWVDVFTRSSYKHILVESLEYCMKNKGLDLYAYVFMTNHVHLIIGTHGNDLQEILRDFKSFTSTSIKKAIKENPKESRKSWMMKTFMDAGIKNSNNNDFQLWQQHNHPLILDSNFKIEQKLEYIHQNPVKQEFVLDPEDYFYSSARNYADLPAPLEIIKL